MELWNIGKLSEEWNTGILEYWVQQKNQEKNDFFSRRIIDDLVKSLFCGSTGSPRTE